MVTRVKTREDKVDVAESKDHTTEYHHDNT